MQTVEINGEQVEVYTAAEVAERETTIRTTVEGEYKPKLTAAETEKARLEGLLEVRAGEIKGIKKLSDEAVSKLSAAERVIYENGLELAAANEKNTLAAAEAKKQTIATVLRTKVGNDAKLLEEATKMYGLVGLDDATPEQIAVRADAAIGALARTQPDILAAAGFSSVGDFRPPVQQDNGAKSYADSPEGKAAAARLGGITEIPKA